MRDDRQQPQSILLINTDVIERNKLEAQVFRAQRMERIGTLAGGIAHDLNNVLAPTLTAMELLRGALSAREEDDEVGVGEVTRRTLEAFGYRALTAKNGAEGLVAFAEHRAEIVLVITDLMMPIMDGPAMVVELRRQSAELPVIAVTGLAAAENRARAREAGVQAFLTKPLHRRNADPGDHRIARREVVRPPSGCAPGPDSSGSGR